MDFVTCIVTAQTAQVCSSLSPCTASNLEIGVLWVLTPSRIPTIVKDESTVVVGGNAQALHSVQIQPGSNASNQVVQPRV